MRLRALVVLLLALIACIALPALAQADGDPGSDELLAQNLFTGDLSVSTAQQLQLGNLLDATSSAGAPVRVALIARADDLGTVTPLWLKPQTYANYLGYELSETYDGRLLIVMPNGVGVYWHANPAGATKLAAQLSTLKPGTASPSALVATTVAAVDTIEGAAGVDASKLAHPVSTNTSAGGNQGASSNPGASRSTKPVTHHKNPTGWFLAALILLALLYVGWRSGAIRKLLAAVGRARLRGELKGVRIRPIALLPTLLLLIIVVALVINHAGSGGTGSATAASSNPNLDPGTQVTPKPAPNFTLTDETGRQVSLEQYRGKAVILAFIDAECQTLCPLTTTAMLDAKRSLGPAGKDVQLLGVNVNWKSTQIDDVLNYTRLHGLLGQWHFLTSSSLPQLERIWKEYGVNEKSLIADDTNNIDHVAAVDVIDPRGDLRTVYTTQSSYSAIPQFGQLLANDVSRVLPDHPKVRSDYSYSRIVGTPPSEKARLPRAGGGTVTLGPGKPHLSLFFATWDTQTTDIAAELSDLDTYAGAAKADGLPQLTAVDEGSVEPSTAALPTFLKALPRALSYPVAIDTSGRLADGYEVEGEPWFVLTSASGQILWDQEVYTAGWPTVANLEQEVHAALSKAPVVPTSERAALDELKGSAPPLAQLHRQESELLPGGATALYKRIHDLTRQGYAVVVNVWASSCAPCVDEFHLFANASAIYGKKVAFLGADNEDLAGDARAFLHSHPVSYPSYSTKTPDLGVLLQGGLEGTPTTVFISPDGKVVYSHAYEYKSQGTLDQDIEDYALGNAG
jgi:cytochrome oxidase Cu insertion factor (SCO1/SenC/PrrC family)/thiol-disulfide isomerase/thioredoxin